MQAFRVLQSSGHSRNEFVLQDLYLALLCWSVARYSSWSVFGITNRILSEPPFFTESVKSFPWAANSSWEQRVWDWLFEVLRTLDCNLGLAHVEFIETQSDFRLVGINARMAGALITPGISRPQTSIHTRWWVQQALGLPACESSLREVRSGYSHVSIYAANLGTTTSILGVPNALNYPGQPE